MNLTVAPGMVGVGQHEKDWYFEVPDELLGRRILAVTRYVSNTPGAGVHGGEEVNEAMVYWECLLLKEFCLEFRSNRLEP